MPSGRPTHTLVGNATWRLLYAANVGVTFVVPPSGAVLIGFGGLIPADGYSTFLSYEIRTGSDHRWWHRGLPAHPSLGHDDIQPPPHGIAANGTGSGSTQWHTAYNAYLFGSGQKLSPRTDVQHPPVVPEQEPNRLSTTCTGTYFIVRTRSVTCNDILGAWLTPCSIRFHKWPRS